jgi:hypothetical protein
MQRVTPVTASDIPSITAQTLDFMRFQPLATGMGIIGVSALAIAHAVRTPAPVGADAAPGAFSAERAFVHVRALAEAPRPAGSEGGHQQAFIYIMSRVAALGMEPYIQATTGIGTRYPVAGRVRNIIARIPGTRPSPRGSAVLLVAHWDGVAAGPAAADDASGVAVLLETLRAIRQGPLQANDVIALFTDSEESGLLGAAAFAREHAWANDVGVILNFEARGTNGPSLMFETGAANYDVVSVLRRVRGARATSLSTAVYRLLPNDTDLSELLLLERPAMNFAFIGGVERYHTSEDDVRHLSLGSLQHHGDQALALTRQFADLRIPRRSAQGDAVFFDLPIVGIVMYPESWALPLALLTLVICLAVLTRVGRRRGAAYLVALFGAAMLVLTLVIAATLAAGIATLLGGAHASLPWGGTPQWRGIYAAALALLTVAIVSAAIGWAGRGERERVRALEAGALTALALVAVVATVGLPGASFLFTWPVLLAGVSALLTTATSRVAFALTARWLATVGIIFLAAPIVYLMVCVALGLDTLGAGALGLLTAFACWVIVPHLTEAPERRWRVPLAGVGASLVLIVAGLLVVRTNAAHPAGASFVYASDSGGAWLAGGATNAWARRWMERELAARADSAHPSDAPTWLARSFARRRIIPVPRVSLPAPTAIVLGDSGAPDARVVTLRVGAPGARSIQVLAEGGVVMRARVDDREVRSDRYRASPRPWRLEYVAPSDNGFILTLALQPGADASISLIARHAGFPSGIPVPSRPPGIIPIGSGDVTYVYRLVHLDRSRPSE